MLQIVREITRKLFGFPYQSLRLKRHPRRKYEKYVPLLYVEGLEQRQLLSANQIAFDSLTSAIVIEGTSASDYATVSTDASNVVHVSLGTPSGTIVSTFQRSEVALVKFIGGDGNDRIDNLTDIPAQAWGDAGTDVLNGGSNNDFLDGGDGEDQLYGNSGKDTLIGGDGDDALSGGDGNDILRGSLGNDYLVGGTGDDQIYGDAGDDTLKGEGGNDALSGGDNNDWLQGGLGNDYLDGGAGRDWLYGEAENDTLKGSDGEDELSGGDGNDWLQGGLGNDYLLGGTGDDSLYGESGDDTLKGEVGNDALSGGDNNDWLQGGLGNDYLDSGAGDDFLYGEEGNDTLKGSDGKDELSGGDGNDLLIGGLGNDYLLGGIGDDSLYGESGDDTLEGEDGNDELSGGDGNDWLQGGLGNDYLVGGIGDDFLYGEEGNDTLKGSDGKDELSGGDGNDWLLGGPGNDYLVGGIGDDSLYGESGDDTLKGEDGNDALSGGDNNDWLQGGLDNDYLDSGAGDDFLYGEEGNDTLKGSDGKDELSGGDGNDWLQGGLGDDYLVGGTGKDTLDGGDGKDSLYGNDGSDSLVGGEGNDWLQGGLGNDLLFGGAGNDYVSGEAGDDTLSGDADLDEILGGDGNDLIIGGDGDDTLDGGSGNDLLFDGDGNDALYGRDGNDILNGNAGNDYLSAGEGNDLLFGGLGKDLLQGDAGEDILIGGRTEYDGDPETLQLLLAAWTAVMPYTDRIQHIQDELFSAHLMPEMTVFDDQVADTLFGGADQDWFFETGYLAVYSPVDHESPVVLDHQAPSDNAGGHDHTTIVVHELPALEGFAFIDSIDKLSDRQANEAIDSLLPHADTPTLRREHLSIFQLVRYDQLTNIAINSGNWSDPATWQNGQVPTDGARVLIAVGVNVRVDGMISARIATVRVDGTLTFDTTRNTELKADTVVVSSIGTFEMGTLKQPIAVGVRARLLITDNGPIDRALDPFGISRGLISHGNVSIHGAEVTSYASIVGPALTGATILNVNRASLLNINIPPTGWKIGDKIVIASTVAGADQNEVRHIAAIFGGTILLDQPLAFNHLTPAANLGVQVANLTRNAVIESENDVPDRRGHVMFMHSREVEIQNAGFYRLGRTNKLVEINDPVVNSDWTLQAGTGTNPRSRYPVHFHRNGLVNDGNPAVVSGSVVDDSPGWGFVNHSGNVDMINNVAFDVSGAAFATEVGDEIGGFYGNLAVGSTGSSQDIEARENKQDFGHQGDGFWFQGGGVSVVGNISAGNSGSAFAYYTRGLIEGGIQGRFKSENLVDPSIAAGAATIPVIEVPVRQFSSNVGYASAVGLTVRYHLQEATHPQRSVFEESQFWNNSKGITLDYVQNTTLRNLTVTQNPGVQNSDGILTNLITGNIIFDTVSVSNYDRGITLPQWGNNAINGGTFSNAFDFIIPNAAWRNRTLTIVGIVSTPRILMSQSLTPPEYHTAEVFFVQDNITLNYSAVGIRRLFFTNQQPNLIPFPSPLPGVQPQYVGLTNQQLWNQYGVTIGGQMAPAGSFSVPTIIGGLIAP